MKGQNQLRIEAWQRRMRAEGLYYDLRAHTKQRALGVAWWHRRLCRWTDTPYFDTGRLRMGPDGFLPRA